MMTTPWFAMCVAPYDSEQWCVMDFPTGSTVAGKFVKAMILSALMTMCLVCTVFARLRLRKKRKTGFTIETSPSRRARQSSIVAIGPKRKPVRGVMQ